VSAGSKPAAVQLGSEGAEQFTLTYTPLGGTAHYRLCEITERSPEEMGPVHKRLDDVKGREGQPSDEVQHQLLREPVSVFQYGETHKLFCNVNERMSSFHGMIQSLTVLTPPSA
jgi:hypothetical protein